MQGEKTNLQTANWENDIYFTYTKENFKEKKKKYDKMGKMFM